MVARLVRSLVLGLGIPCGIAAVRALVLGAVLAAILGIVLARVILCTHVFPPFCAFSALPSDIWYMLIMPALLKTIRLFANFIVIYSPICYNESRGFPGNFKTAKARTVPEAIFWEPCGQEIASPVIGTGRAFAEL